jgi:RNA polymerase sigma factor (sigma-70 family)
MAGADLHAFVQGLCRRLHGDGGVADADLLGRWVAARDEAAFELLLRRHGPLVLGVCRRLLRDAQDVEDAFQASFLLLVRKGASIRRRQSVASWLYKVAYRVCLRARAGRRAEEAPAALEELAARADDGPLWRDLRPVLDEEINALPEKYRVPFVLCHLQGRTNQEAADELGCPLGTVLSRLAWARQRLRGRLARRGVTVATAALAAAVLPGAAEAAVPPALVRATLAAVTGPAGGVTKPVLLAEGVSKEMYLTKLKLAAAVLAVACLGGVGTVAVVHRADAAPGQVEQAVPESPRSAVGGEAKKNKQDKKDKKEKKAKKRDWILVPSRQDGVLEIIGREVKPGENVPADRKAGNFRLLAEGDRVEAGELLARVEDALARADVQIKEAKVVAAEADYRASVKIRDEAEKRWQALIAANRRAPGSVSPEEMRAGQLNYERYVEDAKSREQAIPVARAEVARAQIILRSYEIRSPVRGVVVAILKKRGEAVRALEGVFRVRPDRTGK